MHVNRLNFIKCNTIKSKYFLYLNFIPSIKIIESFKIIRAKSLPTKLKHLYLKIMWHIFQSNELSDGDAIRSHICQLFICLQKYYNLNTKL